MKTFYWIPIVCILLYSCGGSHITASAKKPKKSYRSNRYHPDKKHYHKVGDVVTDKRTKKSNKNKDQAKSEKNKKKQVAQLKQLNSGNAYKNSKKNDAIFYLY